MGYLRLTVDRDGNKIGYDVQKKAILKWAAYRGVEIGRFYQDKDLTAADLNVERPDYEQMLQDIQEGQWGGIVVWRLDRLVRMSFEFERCHKLVTKESNGRIVALDPSEIDSSDEIGAMFMRIMVMFAEMEISGMKARAKGFRRQRAREGFAHSGGPRPFGFMGSEKADDGTRVNVGKAGVEHHLEEATLIQEAAHNILENGWSWTDVLEEWALREPPVVGTTGTPMSVETLKRILTRPRIAGRREAVMEDGEGNETIVEVEAKWDPILTEDQRTKLLSLISVRGPSGRKHEYLGSKILLCECGHHLTGCMRHYRRNGEIQAIRTYRCRNAVQDKIKGACGKLSVLAEEVEKLLVARLMRCLQDTPGAIDALNERNTALDVEMAKALEEAHELEEHLEELQRQMLGARGRALTALIATMDQVGMDHGAAVQRAQRLARRMKVPAPLALNEEDLARWFTEELNLTQQRRVLEGIVDTVVVHKGKSGPRFDPSRVRVTFRKFEHPYAEGNLVGVDER